MNPMVFACGESNPSPLRLDANSSQRCASRENQKMVFPFLVDFYLRRKPGVRGGGAGVDGGAQLVEKVTLHGS